MSVTFAWEVMPYAIALDYYKIWWEEYAADVLKFETLCRCIAGGEEPRRLELVKLYAESVKKRI